MLGLPYPGGPYIDKAATGNPDYVRFPRGLTARKDLERHRFDFSFSGLKTAVARWVEARQRDGLDIPLADVAASFQEAVCDVLSAKAMDACAATGATDLLIGGGVAANGRLRTLLAERAAERGIALRTPRPKPVHRQWRHDRCPGRRDRRRWRQALCSRHRCGLLAAGQQDPRSDGERR